jgi:RES domain-containing protein
VITAWRIVRPEFAADAFRGEGAIENAGRWHSAGTRVVYVSKSVSLATLEIFVHMRKRRILPDYVLFRCTFPEKLVTSLDPSVLPPNWWENPAPTELQQIGDAWMRSGRSAVLEVPDAVTQMEFNYLLNPAHADFRLIEIGAPQPYKIDLRLLT